MKIRINTLIEIDDDFKDDVLQHAKDVGHNRPDRSNVEIIKRYLIGCMDSGVVRAVESQAIEKEMNHA